MFLAEAASVIVNHGIAMDVYGTVEEANGYNALVYVSATTLADLGETDLVREYERRYGQTTYSVVWLTITNDGFKLVTDAMINFVVDDDAENVVSRNFAAAAAKYEIEGDDQ